MNVLLDQAPGMGGQVGADFVASQQQAETGFVEPDFLETLPNFDKSVSVDLKAALLALKADGGIHSEDAVLLVADVAEYGVVINTDGSFGLDQGSVDVTGLQQVRQKMAGEYRLLLVMSEFLVIFLILSAVLSSILPGSRVNAQTATATPYWPGQPGQVIEAGTPGPSEVEATLPPALAFVPTEAGSGVGSGGGIEGGGLQPVDFVVEADPSGGFNVTTTISDIHFATDKDIPLLVEGNLEVYAYAEVVVSGSDGVPVTLIIPLMVYNTETTNTFIAGRGVFGTNGGTQKFEPEPLPTTLYRPLQKGGPLRFSIAADPQKYGQGQGRNPYDTLSPWTAALTTDNMAALAGGRYGEFTGDYLVPFAIKLN